MLTENSDERLKTNIVALHNVLPRLLSISAYSYDWKSGNRSKDKQLGLLAQEVQKAFPELVSEDSNGILSVSYTRFVPLLITAIGEQEQDIKGLKAENALLKDRLDKIEESLNQLLDNKD